MSSPEKCMGVRLVEVSADHDGQRLDNFLSPHLKGLPKAAVYRMIRTGQVRINGKRCKPAARVLAGDKVRIPPARTRQDGQAIIAQGVLEQVRSAILFEDSDYLVVNKPSGMAVHSGSGLPWGLIDVVRQIMPGSYLELAHRLDRETSGCLVLAKSGKSLGHLAGLFRENGVQKRYLCLLDGQMKAAVMEVNAALKKVQFESEKRIIASEEGKSASTRFQALKSYMDCTYAEVELMTGRTHQIRVHAQTLGSPVAGDEKYSGIASLEKWKSRGLQRLFLHAHFLAFEGVAGRELKISAPLPAALRTVLDSLEK